jgi:tRNA 5-methylaminomethyl-2-thiouridine biosynthesis bifunctional protein
VTIEWREGRPWSPRYGDGYCSADSGLAEKRHVFLAGNDLPARFAALPPRGHVAIGETGFGTGLNFLATWQCFLRYAPPGASLDYFSIEKHPLSDAELVAALSPWSELACLTALLAARWQRRVPGWNRFAFAAGRVRLTLAVADVAEALPELPAESIDAWFLDGFAPDRNPDMWSAEVARLVARASRKGGSFATYTCAGWVRRNLTAAGFVTEKAPGFGRKREMLRGRKPGHPLPPPVPPRRVLVVGAGLAGSAAAFAIARRGIEVEVIDADGVAAGASGNPVGMLYCRLSAGMGGVARVALAGFGHALGVLDETLPVDGENRAQCGLLQLAVSAKEAARIEKLAALSWECPPYSPVTAAEAEELAGVPLRVPGLWFPQAGWVAPRVWCKRLLDGLPVRCATVVTALVPSGAGWRLQAGNGVFDAEAPAPGRRLPTCPFPRCGARSRSSPPLRQAAPCAPYSAAAST